MQGRTIPAVFPLSSDKYNLFNPCSDSIKIPPCYTLNPGDNIVAAGLASLCFVELVKRGKPCVLYNFRGEIMQASAMPDLTFRYPLPGDAVRLQSKWACVAEGSIGIINGVREAPEAAYKWGFDFEQVFYYTYHRHLPGPTTVTFYGGIHTDFTAASQLEATDQQITVNARRWKTRPHMDEDEDYRVIVPLWHWHPAD